MRRVLMMCITSCSTTCHSKIHITREPHLHTEAFTFYLHAFSVQHLICVFLFTVRPHCILPAYHLTAFYLHVFSLHSTCIPPHCILSTYLPCISLHVSTFSIALTLIQKVFDILSFTSHLHDSLMQNTNTS